MILFNICELYRQEFALFSWYSAGKLTQAEYLDYMKPLDKAISELEINTFKDNPLLKKAFLQHFQKPKH